MKKSIELFKNLIDEETKKYNNLDNILINQMNNYNNTFLLKKILLCVKNFFMGFIIKVIEFNYQRKNKKLTDSDKLKKVMNQKVIKKDNLIVEYNLVRQFENKIMVKDYGCIDISSLEYSAFLVIKYNDISSNHYFEKRFNKYDKALKYFNKLVKDNEVKTIDELIKKKQQYYL